MRATKQERTSVELNVVRGRRPDETDHLEVEREVLEAKASKGWVSESNVGWFLVNHFILNQRYKLLYFQTKNSSARMGIREVIVNLLFKNRKV